MYNSLYPVHIKPYSVNTRTVKKKEDEESSNSKAQTQEAEENRAKSASQKSQQSAVTYPRQTYANGQQTAIDYSHSTVNVAQILTDFKNTTAAIGAPDTIKGEVETYFGLIEAESLKDNPNGKIIQTNLKTAANILDNYIAETLKKPSDVVEKWIDALFLQKIDFKSDPTAINPDFQVQLPNKTQSTVVEATTEDNQENQTSTTVANPTIPQNSEVKKAFIQGKKYSAINDTEKALTAFENALKIADEQQDKDDKSLIFLEVAKIYDGHDLLPQALLLYNKAATDTTDPNIKTKAYYSMAKIYDEAVQFTPAMEHYYASIAYAGETENLNTQTFSLMNIASMYADKYEANEAKSYFQTAHDIVEETGNDKLAGKVYRLSASKMSSLNETKTALDYYKESSYHFNQDNNPIELANNYSKSSDLMLKLGNRNKAKSLLEKAKTIYKQNNCAEKIFDTEKKLQAIS